MLEGDRLNQATVHENGELDVRWPLQEHASLETRYFRGSLSDPDETAGRVTQDSDVCEQRHFPFRIYTRSSPITRPPLFSLRSFLLPSPVALPFSSKSIQLPLRLGPRVPPSPCRGMPSWRGSWVVFAGDAIGRAAEGRWRVRLADAGGDVYVCARDPGF